MALDLLEKSSVCTYRAIPVALKISIKIAAKEAILYL